MNREQRREWRRDIKRRQRRHPKTKGTEMLARERWQVMTINVLDEVFEERVRQVKQYGFNENVQDGSGPETRWLLPYTVESADAIEDTLRDDYEEFKGDAPDGLPTWVHLVREEVAEAFKESDPERLEEELVQVAALCVSWIENLRKRGHESLI